MDNRAMTAVHRVSPCLRSVLLPFFMLLAACGGGGGGGNSAATFFPAAQQEPETQVPVSSAELTSFVAGTPFSQVLAP